MVVFGSRTTRYAEESSDWDILCVGNGRSIRKKSVDLIWLRPHLLKSNRWLGSELAGHISKFGVWLFGDDSWKSKVFNSKEALNFKRRCLNVRIKNTEKKWKFFSDPYKAKYSTLIRRDLQRYDILKKDDQVPPTIFIDKEWKRLANKKDIFLQLANDLGFHSVFLEREIALFID